jgi:hypothetical protein
VAAAAGASTEQGQQQALLMGEQQQAALVGASHGKLLLELEQKQALINRLLRDVDGRTSALARVGHDLVSMRDRHALLESEHARTRRELAEKERVLDRFALDSSQVEHIDPAELARRHRMLGGAYRAEKARSDELARQLGVLSERVGQAGRLENAYVSLQDAHRAQGSELQRLQAEAVALPKYKQAVKAQERVIAKLESLVKPAMRGAREAKGISAEHARLKSRIVELEAHHAEATGIGTEEHVKLVMRAEQVRCSRLRLCVSRARARTRPPPLLRSCVPCALARRSAQTARRRCETARAARIAPCAPEAHQANLRARLPPRLPPRTPSRHCPQAERRAMATEEELADAARKYAREIATLKLKLAEKEAELLGGFGSPRSPGLSEAADMRESLPRGEMHESMPREVRAPRAARACARQMGTWTRCCMRPLMRASTPAPLLRAQPPKPMLGRQPSTGLRRGSASKLESLVPRTPPHLPDGSSRSPPNSGGY